MPNQYVYIHCCAHHLNTAMVDMVKAIPAAEDFLLAAGTVCLYVCLKGFSRAAESIESVARGSSAKAK